MLLVAAAATLNAAYQAPSIRRPVLRFIDCYQQSENTNAPMNLWERVVYSILLTRTTSS